VAELEGVISQKALFGVGVLVALGNVDPLRTTIMPLGEMPSSYLLLSFTAFPILIIFLIKLATFLVKFISALAFNKI
jgi:hypothetical protein